ncbi:MAG: hybrid sensor histidine kinase/response regulator [Bacteroidetes bacterium]|nr:MAG: hybrid sensor histidine kinase/response regulator [Bacteroidota bacterium]
MKVKPVHLFLIIFILHISCSFKPEVNDDLTGFRITVDSLNIIKTGIENFEPPEVISFPMMKRFEPEVLSEYTHSVYMQSTLESEIVALGAPEVIYLNDTANVPPTVSQAKPDIYAVEMPVSVEVKEPMAKVANPYSFAFYTRVQGLQQDDISTIVQDKMGNLWFGTYGAGIIRYDGRHFSHFDTKNGLTDNHVLSLLFDNKGDLWIGTRLGGLVQFDGKKFTVFNERTGLNNNSVESIFQDSKGNYWIGTYGGGVSFFDGEYFTHYTTEQGLAGNIVITIEEDHLGNMWFGTRGNGVSVFDGEKFYNYTTKQGLGSDFIINSLIDSKGRIWFGTDGAGVNIIDGNKITRYTEESGLPDRDILNLYEDNKGNIWLGTRRAGIVKISGERFTKFREQEGLINTFITCFLEDNSGKMWFGTYGGGVGRYNGDMFRHFSENEGLKDSFIRSIGQDKKGDIWLGSHANGIFRFDGSKFKNYSLDKHIRDNRVRSIFRDSRGDIWFGVLGGYLIRFDGEHFYYTAFRVNEIGVSVISFAEDPDGNIWFATNGDGLFQLKGDSVINYTEQNGLKDNFLRKVVFDSKGNLWAAARNGGITKFDGKYFYYYNQQTGLPGNDFFDLIADSRDLIWAGTNGKGVILIKDEYYIQFTESNGLGSNFVYSALEDNNGDLWFGTRMGLSRFICRQLLESSSPESFQRMNIPHNIFFKNYSRNDGFVGIGSNSRSIYEDTEGIIWVGANDILTAFDPKGEKKDMQLPDMRITGVGLFTENINWAGLLNNKDTTLILSNGVEVKRAKLSGITPWYGLPENLRLKYNNNYIVFNYVGIATRFNKQLRYQYMLDRLEEDWNVLTHRTEAHYGNLPPGNYNFMVRAVDSNGNISKVSTFAFRINRPWWTSPIAYTVYIVLLLVGILAYDRFRKIQNQLKEQRRVEEMMLHQEIEIARKAVEFKQNFLANMSHEIRTPLTGMLGMADLLNKTNLNTEQQDYLETLIHSGENLRETINLVLDYSKIEAGKIKLRDEVFTIDELFEDAEKLFKSICRKDLKFSMENDKELTKIIVTDRKRVFQILSNLLSNAVKFTTEGSINIRAFLVKEMISEFNGSSLLIKIEVTDTGKGISEADQKNLFKPFYQVDQDYDRAYEGTGLGLSISRELAMILGGKIGVESKTGKGSKFWFTFRAKVSHAKLTDQTQRIRKSEKEKKQMHILLVEDKKVNQKVVQLMLKRMGHSVTVSENGRDALEQFEPGLYDLILMDIQMPLMDGITATEKLRKKYDKLPPIIGLSANAFEGDREKYMNMGMDEYITKPVKSEDFSNLLNKLNI